MYTIKRFDKIKDKLEWNHFVSKSKNGTFLFYRDYMDYHSDRFEDHSLLIYRKKELVALLPANSRRGEFISHEGLTYGGIISSYNMKAYKMLEIFDIILEYLKSKKFKLFVYKTIPTIYHKTPAEEDQYALFINNAHLFRRDICTVIPLENKSPKKLFERCRIRGIDKARRDGVLVKESHNTKDFFHIIDNVLQKNFNKTAPHSYKEISLLMENFPYNIHLFACYLNDKIISGALIYETDTVAHAQYVFSSEEGKNHCANDMMYNFLIQERFYAKSFFDFGISNENNGKHLNHGLISQKESFGGRSICHDFYKIDL
jgi:hypothetical protein